ncbi:MAG: hypothetical protein AB2L24_05000 [Mangrovibacterium sp.]
MKTRFLKNIRIVPSAIVILAGIVVVMSFDLIPGPVKTEEQHVCQVTIHAGSADFELFQVSDTQNIPVFYYLDIDQYPCDDSVCARMQLRIYWDMWGNFLKLGFGQGQELTKIGHDPFNTNDYARLHRLLNNPKSSIGYFRLENLTAKESEDEYYSADAISGATIHEAGYESVNGAVKTCYTLWKIVNGEIQKHIREKTIETISAGYILPDNEMTTANLAAAPADKQIRILSRLIGSGQKIPDDVFKSMMPGFSEKPSAYLLCLLELARKKEGTASQFVEELSAQIGNKQTPAETAIYNFLSQQNFKTKNVRKHLITKDYF